MKTKRFKTVILFLVLVGAVFFTMSKAKGIPIDPFGIEEESYVCDIASVERFAVQCFDFTRLQRKVCVYEGSELVSDPEKKFVLDMNFTALVAFSNSARIPQTSWLEIVEFSSVPEVFVRLSDGTVVYGAGKGSTFKEAMSDLTLHFLAKAWDDADKMETGDKKPAGNIKI